MAEPPAKRPRRDDVSAIREENPKSSSRPDRERPVKPDIADGERHDRDRRDGRRDRDRDRDRDRNPRDGRNGDARPRGREERDRDRRRDRSRSRERMPRDDARPRSRSPVRDSRNGATRARSPPRGPRSDRDRHRDPPDRQGPTTNGHVQSSSRPGGRIKDDEGVDTKMVDGLEELDEEERMLKIMGFGGFRSTKNTKVPGNDKNYGVRKEKKSMYRQYMNRQGGFNRPLSPS